MNKVEEILKQYPYIGEDIQQKQSEINRYISLQQEARNPLKAQNMSGMPHSSGISDQTADAVEKIIDQYQGQINKYIDEINSLLDLKKWLDKAFSQLSESERRIIYLRYEKGENINKMPYLLKWKCGRNTIYKILDEAKEKIKKII